MCQNLPKIAPRTPQKRAKKGFLIHISYKRIDAREKFLPCVNAACYNLKMPGLRIIALLNIFVLLLVFVLAVVRQQPSHAHLLAASDFWRFDSDIHLQIPGSAHKNNLTYSPAIDTQPIWSPDGRWIAFASDRETRNGGRSLNSIYIIHPNGNGLRKVGSGSPATGTRMISWSPDGEWLYVKYITQGWWDNYFYRLADGHTTTLRFENTFNLYASWSPTGEWLAYRSGVFESPQTHLAIARPDEGDTVTNVKILARSSDYIDYLLWSPSGEQIAYTSIAAGTFSQFFLYVVAADGQPNRLVYTSPAPFVDLAWSPDEQSLLFTIDRPGGVYTLDTHNGVASAVLHAPTAARQVLWLPDSIIFSAREDEIHDALYRLQGQTLKKLHTATRHINRLIVSDGWIYFDVGSREQAALYRIRSDGGQLEYLTETAFNWDIPLSPVVDLPWRGGLLGAIAGLVLLVCGVLHGKIKR